MSCRDRGDVFVSLKYFIAICVDSDKIEKTFEMNRDIVSEIDFAFCKRSFLTD